MINLGYRHTLKRLKSGIGEPVLDQNLRFRCPIYVFLKFSKPCVKSLKRLIWLYEKGDYNLLRDKISATDWDQFKDNNINN
jgi:hypothetical protein